MFIGVGVGDYTAGIFHLLTHGAFKALLFLAAGSVMHALANEVDVRKMGGLWRIMPVTASTSLIGVLAISGIPFLSGFYSKEEILGSAAAVGGAGIVIWVIGLVTAGLTAFYMARWFILVFLGPPRWRETEHPVAAAGQEEGVSGEPARAELHPHESPPSMTLPLIVLAIGSAFGGLLNLNAETGFLHGWLAGTSVLPFEAESEVIPETALVASAVVVGLLGLALAVVMYLRVDIGTVGVGTGPRRAARQAFGVDTLYDWIVVRPGRALATFFTWFDGHVVDGLVNGAGGVTQRLAGAGRRLQTGFVRSYALAVLGGAVLVTVLLLGSGLGGLD
jgi:NADH-quinone oxidoreductase subunit L